MAYQWEIEKARTLTSAEIKNLIWAAVNNGQPIPGCMSVEALRFVLIERGKDGKGYHNS